MQGFIFEMLLTFDEAKLQISEVQGTKMCKNVFFLHLKPKKRNKNGKFIAQYRVQCARSGAFFFKIFA